MKLSLDQKKWIQNYEAAKRAGGTYDPDRGWVPIDEISVPEWYTDYVAWRDGNTSRVQGDTGVSKTSDAGSIPAPDAIKMNDAMRQFLQKNNVQPESDPKDWREIFRQSGRKGGTKTRERGSEFYRAIGRMGGRGNRKA